MKPPYPPRGNAPAQARPGYMPAGYEGSPGGDLMAAETITMPQVGFTVREELAARVLVALLGTLDDPVEVMPHGNTYRPALVPGPTHLARLAVQCADALLVALSAAPEPPAEYPSDGSWDLTAMGGDL